MKCGLKHILSWQCLLQHFNQKHLAFVLSLRSVYSRFTPYRIKQFFLRCFLFLLILFPVSGINPVYAQTPTDTPVPTATPTYSPIFNPVTPTQINVECPGSQPIGWGTVTPAPIWSMYCQKCVTPIPGGWNWGENPLNQIEYQPTNFYGWTPTPITDNPTPIPTPTQNFVDLDTIHMHGVENLENIIEGQPFLTGANDVRYNAMHLDSYRTIQVPSNYPGVLTKYYVQFDGTFAAVGQGSSTYTGTLALKIYCDTNECHIKHNGNTIDLTNGQSYTIWTGSLILNQGGVLQTGVIDLEISFISTNNSYRHLDIELTKNAYWLFDHNTYSTMFTWDYEPISLEPEPIDSYCSEVLPNQDTPGLGDPGSFELPTPGIGQSTCFTFLNLTIPLAWLSPAWPDAHDIGLPGWNFCFMPIHFGNLSMFGLSIDLDLIAMAIGAIVLIRLITRS